MDKKIHELYILLLKKNARVARFTEYDAYYEFEIEWEFEMAKDIYLVHPGVEKYFQKKLFAFAKIRR